MIQQLKLEIVEYQQNEKQLMKLNQVLHKY